MKTVFVPALDCELVLLAGLRLRRKSATERGGLQFASTVILLVTLATFVGGCSSMPHSRNTGATITVIGTGPGNQSVMVPLTINIQNKRTRSPIRILRDYLRQRRAISRICCAGGCATAAPPRRREERMGSVLRNPRRRLIGDQR
jgi:hypothetical protein